MGTRGRYVFCYKKKYYIFYNRFDSHFNGLGWTIVTELRAMTEADLEELKALIDAIPSDFVRDDKHMGADYEGLKKALVNYKSVMEISTTRPSMRGDIFIEYQYTVDLDRMQLEVMWNSFDEFQDTQRFWLKNIPKDWKALCRGSRGDE